MSTELLAPYLADPDKIHGHRVHLRELLQVKHQVGEALKANAVDGTIGASIERDKLTALQNNVIQALAKHDAYLTFEGATEYERIHGRSSSFPINLVPIPGMDGHIGGPRVPSQKPDGRKGLSNSIRTALMHASQEEREQVSDFVAYMQGRMSAATNFSPSGDGAYLIPTFIAGLITRDYAAFTPVVNVCRIFATDDGAPVTFPVLSDSEVAVQLDSEALTGADATVSGDTPPTTLTGPTLKSYKISSQPVFVPRETLTDSGLDLISEVLAALVARIARKENSLYTNGTGSGQAQGFLPACSNLLEAAVLDLDVALDLAYTVPQMYRPKGVYMMSDGTAKYLRKLKTGISGDKRVIWTDANFQTGQPATLHGYPVAINNDMPDIAASGYVAGHEMAFGDFSKFVVRQAENNQPWVYNYAVPAKDGRGVIAFRRSDSKLLVPKAIAKLSVGGS
jgi:HK97 family phage major capsid protein